MIYNTHLLAMNNKPYHHLPDGSFRNPEGSPKRDENIKWSYRIFNKEKKKLDMTVPKNHIVDKEIVLSSLNKFKNDDFIYLDPPYVPENKDSFVSYTVDGFDFNTHKKLFDIINQKKTDNKFVMSNSYTEIIMNEFNECNCDIIEVKRRINSKKPDDKTNEVIIYN